MVSVSKFLQTMDATPGAGQEGEMLAHNLIDNALRLDYAPHDVDTIRRMVASPGAQAEHFLPSQPNTSSIYEASIRKTLFSTRENISGLSERICSLEHDALLTDDDDWPVEKVVNIALLRRIIPSKSLAIVTSIRNEGLALLEWVAHHLAQGVEKIFVYANDNDDGSTPLIETLDRAGFITFIENINSHKVSPQRKAYEHSLNILFELRQYRWVLYLDADEFFISRHEPKLDLASLLLLPELAGPASDIDAIMFNWKWFGSENSFERTAGLLLDRFVHSKHESHVKGMVRLSNTLSLKHLHYPVLLYRDRAVRSDLTRPEGGDIIRERAGPIYGLGQINHYWNRSFEEYLIKKSRGRGAVVGGDEQRDFQSFFQWGDNGTRGNFDPPPARVTNRTKQFIEQMMQQSEIRGAMIEIERGFKLKLKSLASEIDVRTLYESRGQSICKR